jgi:cbb3-type cytochrome c oxidase subunit III
VRYRVAGVVVVAAAALFAAGCGTGGKASSKVDIQNGQKLFSGAGTCSACHTLAAAGSHGTVGPNLDDAFRSDRQQGFKQSSIQNVVLDQIRQASGKMPKNLVKGQDAQDVAAYVASVAGVAGASSGPAANVGTDGKAIFSANCASCHTLAAANATGTVGPNLDQLKPAQARVQHQVEVGGGVMPAFKGTLTAAQIAAVAKFVASSAGK